MMRSIAAFWPAFPTSDDFATRCTIVRNPAFPYDSGVTQAYQNFVPAYPRFHLATLPTPLERAPRLEAALRDEGCASVPRIYLKRDDLLSLGMGGNKIRNLEFSIGLALAEAATDVVTSGRQQSNHCRLTAAACARAGLRAHLVFSGDPPPRASGNLLLDDLLGAKLYYACSDDRARREAWVNMLSGGFEAIGRRAFVIPVGGSDARGALGHALAALELTEQCAALGERLDAIVLATATGGTQAGMLAGLQKAGVASRVSGFAVAKSAAELSGTVLRIANEVAADIGVEALGADAVDVDGSRLGDGYGAPSVEAEEASRMLARTEGVFADPVYTGKGLAGLLSLIREERFAPDACVVFLHTGGAPAIFADSHAVEP